MVAIYIAVSHDYPNNILPILGQQVAWIALGLVIGFVLMLFNTEFLWKITPYLYALGLALNGLTIGFFITQVFELQLGLRTGYPLGVQHSSNLQSL